MLSPLATRVSTPFTNTARNAPVYGVAFHTTGSGLPAEAVAKGQDPLQAAITYYVTSKGPTYVIPWSGQIVAVAADESVKTNHIGVEAHELGPLKGGTWRQLVSPRTAQLWDRRWGAGKNPISSDGTTARSLIPSDSPNNAVIGVEMIPVTGDGRTFWADPMRRGLRFTRAQHDAANALAHDIARRYGWPAGWERTRVFGHEDLNPIRRHDAGGGWDPGRLRDAPYIDMDAITGGGIIGSVLVAAALAGAIYLATR
jgi:hypothetical protein